MKPILTRLFAGIFLLIAAQSFAQTTISTNFVVTSPAGPTYPIGSHIVVELRVNNFTNVESMQFPITYNKAALKFDSLSNPAFSNWSAGNYVSNPSAGKVGISWDGYSNGASMPFSFPNGTALFKLHFTAIADGYTVINIAAAAAPPAIDIVSNGATATLNYQGGGTPNLTIGAGQALVGFKIIANPIYIPQGERGCVPITVNDFNLIQSMQWAVHWDNTVLNYECTRNYGLSGWSATDFSTSPVQSATLLAAWADPAGVGVTKPNGAKIVDICFKAIGAPGSAANITIDGAGFAAGAGSAEAYSGTINPPVDVWTTGGPNGASGIGNSVNVLQNSPSPSDVTFTVDQIEVAPQATGCVGVKVKNFTSVNSSEFALAYNPTQLVYQNVDFGSNPLNIQAANIKKDSVSPTQFVIKFFNWTSAAGATVPDNTNIFSLCFKVLAPAGTTANINFTSTACPSPVGIAAGKQGGGVPVARNNGWIKSAQAAPLTITNVKCFGGSTGAISADVTALPNPTSYAWSSTVPGFSANTKDISNLAAGTYTVTITYSGGATVTNSGTVIQPASAVSEAHTVNSVSCFGGNNGAINLTPAGGTSPYTFAWSDGATTEDRSGLTSSIYTVTVKDKENCAIGPVNITVSGFSQVTVPNPNVTNVTCAGLNNGAITIAPTGGAGGYTYLWSPGGGTQATMNQAPAGTYTVKVTDVNGCTANFGPYSITAPQQLVAGMVSKSDVKCMGSATGGSNITVSGGTGNMSYCWKRAQDATCVSTVEDPSNLGVGTWTVTVTDQNGCTATVSSVVISEPSTPLSVTGNTTPSPCFEQASGSVCATPAGGWGNYTYAWSGGLPAISCPPNLSGGSYTVTVSDAGQCTATQSFTVAGAPAITKNEQVQNVTCFGAGNGGINLNLSGGNPAYSVAWSNTGLTGQSISNLGPGNYQPTVTDAQGCTKVFPAISVSSPAELMVTENIVEANPNGSIDLTIVSGGTAPFTINWSGPAGNGNTEPIVGPAGNYNVTITDANNCVRTFQYAIPEGNVVFATKVDSVHGSCDHDGCIFLTIPSTAAAQTPFTINWGTPNPLSTNNLHPSICGLGPGVYHITVTAANGNSVVLNTLPDGFNPIEVKQKDPASVNINTSNPFDEQHNGKIILNAATGVIGPLTYNWAPIPSNSNQLLNIDSGLYSVTITNQFSGCTSVQSFHLVREYCAPLSTNPASVLQPKCATDASGAISIQALCGNDPYTYKWTGPNNFSSNQQNISSLMPGVYNLTVTDANGTTLTQTYTLANQSNLLITNVNETSLYPSGDQVSGFGICDGAANVAFASGVGATTIAWSNGVATANNTTLCGGPYSVTVTDALGCSSSWSDSLTQPTAISAIKEAVKVTCFGDCDGSAKVRPAGGAAPYSVRWSTSQFDPQVLPNQFSQAVNLCGGDYTVTITDKNGVISTLVVTVPEPAEIAAVFSETTPRNFNACDGELLLNPVGAAAPVTYTWSGSFGHTGNTERAINLCAGEFVEYLITDANGCTAYASDSIPYPEDGCFRVSPVITPGQQDGKNDFVVITCIETALKNHMEIYNRWGQLVFETDNYTNNDTDTEHNWNGLNTAGSALAEGVYYYVLTYTFLDDQGQQHEGIRKGAINLLR